MSRRRSKRLAKKKLQLERLESRMLLTTLVINEFMASNKTTIQDSFGDYSDWIELQNDSPDSIDLAGWHLTDDSDDLGRWTFPSITLTSGDRLVVFASSRDLTDPAGELHTDFKLKADGEFLALSDPQDQIQSSYSPSFPSQTDDISYGLNANGEERFFDTPSPWDENTGGVLIAADVATSHPTGFQDNEFQLELSTTDPAATIRYTTNGSVPTASNGTVYSGPITIDGSSVIRTGSFRAGFDPSPIETRTYLFVEDAVTQSSSSAFADGFPGSWGSRNADYDMDTNIVGPNDQFNGTYANSVRDDLKSISSLSLVIDQDEFFGQTGIYSNPRNRGELWERAVTGELINAETGSEVQFNSGIRIQGGISRVVARKNSLRLAFRAEYGDGTLQHAFFGDAAASDHNSIVLRSSGGEDFVGVHYIRDTFARESLRATGQPAPNSRWLHVYINGLYWGMYEAVERPDSQFMTNYFGGNREDWDVVNAGDLGSEQDTAIDGNLLAWNELIGFATQMQSAATEQQRQELFMQIQGLNTDGTRNPLYEDLLDVDNYIDYLITNWYLANRDWPHRNYYFGRDRGSESTGFKFFTWDAEFSLQNVGTNPNIGSFGLNRGPSAIFPGLKLSQSFRVRFADRVEKHFGPGGAFYSIGNFDPANPQNNVPGARYNELVEKVFSPIVPETARWGDSFRQYLTRDELWMNDVNRHLSFTAARSPIIENIFRAEQLYLDAPQFNTTSSEVPLGFPLSINSQAAGDIYYTLDGSDPRNIDGTINSNAILFVAPLDVTHPIIVNARQVNGTTWSAINSRIFVIEGENEISPLRITEMNYHPHPPTAEELAISADFTTDSFEYIEIENKGSEAVEMVGHTFTNGIDFSFLPFEVNAGQRVLVVANQQAFEARYGQDQSIAGEYSGQLANNGERVELLDARGNTIHSFLYDDNNGWPQRADGHGSSLEVIDTEGNYNDGDNWRASGEFSGSPGTSGIGYVGDIVINEVLSHTDAPLVDTIELYNTTNQPIDISGWYLSDSHSEYAKFQIPETTVLDGNNYLFFDESDFNATGGASPLDFALSSSRGDEVLLTEVNPQGEIVRFADFVEFGAQANGESWARTPNGTGIIYPAQQRTLGSENQAPRVGPVVISEIMYNPLVAQGEDPDDFEFLEIFNPTGQEVDLTQWRIRGGVDFDFPDSLLLDSEAAIVIAGKNPSDPDNAQWLADFRDHYQLGNEVIILGGLQGKLDNNGERIRLLRPDLPPADDPQFIPRLLEDETRYYAVAPWATSPDGQGDSLTRLFPAEFGWDATSWQAAPPTPGGVFDQSIPPSVESVQINNSFSDPADLPSGQQPTSWSNQRSDIRSLEIHFSHPVEFDLNDIQLINLGLDAPNDPDVEFQLTNDHITHTVDRIDLSFGHQELAEGVYELRIRDTMQDIFGNSLDGNDDGAAGGDYVLTGDATNKLYKQLTNWNGDLGVSVFDFTTVSYWFGVSVPTAPAYVDVSSDDGISVFDFSFFANRFGDSVEFPQAFGRALLNPTQHLDNQVDLAIVDALPEAEVGRHRNSVERLFSRLGERPEERDRELIGSLNPAREELDLDWLPNPLG
jgi:hypothetical protein